MASLLNVVILGRPNVGKSTLFNRLSGKRTALVHDRPGVTRDWRSAEGGLADLNFLIYDTAGLDGFESPEIKEQILIQTDHLLQDADIILFVVDGREGITASEKMLAQKVRELSKPVILIANKCEGKSAQHHVHDAYGLGLGDPLPFSAEHGQGMDNLYHALLPYFKSEAEMPLPSLQKKDSLRLIIAGRPNVGKSTLMNAFLGESRVLTGDQPGLTRDSVMISWRFADQEIELVDTAGLRRRHRIDDGLEKLSAQKSLLEIRYAHVVILVLDAHDPLNKQDLTIAAQVIEEGRVLVLALNKWDEADHKQWPDILHKIGQSLSQVKGIPIIPISALRHQNLDKLMKAVLKSYTLWQSRISTGQLNQWLNNAVERHPPPLSQGMRIRFKYGTQIKSRPPTFVFFVSKPVDVPESYMRYLMDSLRASFDLTGIPLRLFLRKGKNPYTEK